MLWYFLYPYRGTTSAPHLSPDHPLRRIPTRYGVGVARHVAATLLMTVAVATALLYPIPFLYTSDFTSSASSLPRHVWTNAQPVKGELAVEPDVIMRSIWVHGSYMEALERNVLLGALELQDQLLGPTKDFSPRRPSNHAAQSGPPADLTVAARDAFHVINGLTNQSWFFHSPLLYWAGDRDAILHDPDILGTVNEHKKQHTSVNVTLRHSVVFSGKRYEDRALVAADALVVTLIHLRDSPVGRQWERKAADLVNHVADEWDVYPRDAQDLSSQLYEFQFLPISLQDSAMLALAYCLTLAYVLQNLSKLPAIKSRPGLIVTVIAQIFVSIMSSFTVCAIFKVDLSRIPRAAYPIVIVSMSLENMLRLIRAVIATNLRGSTSSCVGEAFGKTAYIAFASVVEHLLLLGVISQLVTSGLSDFFTFLAVAIVFDFFYLSTFFLSVLSVEVRRSELSDMIEKSSSRQRSLQPYDDPAYVPPLPSRRAVLRQSWIAAVLGGRADASTRIAGTVILLGFVIIAQWHFFDNESMSHTLRRLVNSQAGLAGGENNLTARTSASGQVEELHQARGIASWLRIQDHETAQEVIRVVKPWAHSYVARVYEPLVLVLKGSDRMRFVTERPFLPAVYDFIRHQSKPFVVTVLVFTAVMRIFMNYLLWDEMGDTGGDMEPANEQLLSVKTLDQGHTLDVALLTASSDGLVVSVGLDRWIRVWSVPFGGMSYLVTRYDPPHDVPFPVLALAINDDSTWLAILSSYRAILWNLESKQWGPSIAVDLCGQRPEALFFKPGRESEFLPSLILIRRNGTLVELFADTGKSTEHPICRSTLLGAIPLYHPHTLAASYVGSFAVITVSRNGCIHRVTPVGDRWISEEVKQQAGNKEHAHSLVAMPEFPAYLVARRRSVDLVDLATSETLHTFRCRAPIRPRTLRYLCSVRRQCRRGLPELGHFSLAYTSSETGSCVMQTYFPRDEDGSIVFFLDGQSLGASANDDTSCAWHETRQVIKEVPSPGVWEALPSGYVVGVRPAAVAAPNSGPGGASGFDAAPGKGSGRSRRRGLTALSPAAAPGPTKLPSPRKAAPCAATRGSWEAWSLCSTVDDIGNSNGSDSSTSEGSSSKTSTSRDKHYVTRAFGVDRGELLVTEPGPMACAGASTVVVGLGAGIKVITMGHERFGTAAEMLEAAAGQIAGAAAAGKRRRKNRSVQKTGGDTAHGSGAHDDEHAPHLSLPG